MQTLTACPAWIRTQKEAWIKIWHGSVEGLGWALVRSCTAVKNLISAANATDVRAGRKILSDEVLLADVAWFGRFHVHARSLVLYNAGRRRLGFPVLVEETDQHSYHTQRRKHDGSHDSCERPNGRLVCYYRLHFWRPLADLNKQ